MSWRAVGEGFGEPFDAVFVHAFFVDCLDELVVAVFSLAAAADLCAFVYDVEALCCFVVAHDVERLGVVWEPCDDDDIAFVTCFFVEDSFGFACEVFFDAFSSFFAYGFGFFEGICWWAVRYLLFFDEVVVVELFRYGLEEFDCVVDDVVHVVDVSVLGCDHAVFAEVFRRVTLFCSPRGPDFVEFCRSSDDAELSVELWVLAEVCVVAVVVHWEDVAAGFACCSEDARCEEVFGVVVVVVCGFDDSVLRCEYAALFLCSEVCVSVFVFGFDVGVVEVRDWSLRRCPGLLYRVCFFVVFDRRVFW